MVSDGLCQVGGREERVLNVFKVVQFPNAACNTSTGTVVSKVLGFFNFCHQHCGEYKIFGEGLLVTMFFTHFS